MFKKRLVKYVTFCKTSGKVFYSYIYLAIDTAGKEAVDFLKIEIMMLEIIRHETIFRPDSKRFAISLRLDVN